MLGRKSSVCLYGFYFEHFQLFIQMRLTAHGNPGTAAAADVYDRRAHACAHTSSHTQTDILLCRGLKMEPEPQNTILSFSPPTTGWKLFWVPFRLNSIPKSPLKAPDNILIYLIKFIVLLATQSRMVQ